MVHAKITRIVSVAVIIIGLVVMIGWFTDDDALKRLNPDWVTMKFSTATSFFVSGMIIFFLNESRNKNSEAAKILIFAPMIIVLFFMATLMVSTISGTSSGVSSLFVKEEASAAVRSVTAGTPSVGTMVNFLLIIGVGFTYLLVHPKHRKYLYISGGIILALAIIALIGYAIDSPALYYQVEGASGAMALHTAIAFALLGIGSILLAKPEYIERGFSEKKHFLKISTKLTSAFLISAFFPIIVIGFISFSLAEISLEKEHFIELDKNAILQIHKVEDFFFDRKADASVLSHADLFKREIPILNQFYNEPTNIQYIESDEHTDEKLEIVREAYGYDNIMLLNPEGTIIFVSKNEQKPLFHGKSFLDIDPDTFTEGKKDVYISNMKTDVAIDGTPLLFISSPILDDEKNLLGILVFDITIHTFLDHIVEDSYIGETAEALFVKKQDEEIIMLNTLRFPPAMKMTMVEMMKGEAGPAAYASSGFSGAGFDFDYRQHEIIAVWKHIPSLDWGIVSKIDTAEAFAPIDQLERDITVLAIVFMIGIGFFGLTVSRTISNPLNKLKNLSDKISKGDLDSRVLVQSSDELGQLTKMMNETAVKLKNTQKEKEKERDELDNFKNILDQSALVSITDKEGTITYVNQKFVDVSKYPREELIGQNHRILKSGYHSPEFFDGLWKTISSGKVWKADIKNRAKDGSFYWVKTVIVPFIGKDGKPEQYIAARVEITKQKETEEKLAKALEEVKMSDLLKDEFASMVTHELKTPLVPIQGFCEILNDPDSGKLNEIQKEAVDEIYKNSHELLKLIQNMLTAQKAELHQLKFNLENIDVSEYMGERYKNLENLMREKHIEFVNSAESGLKIKGDVGKLNEIFANMIQNAVDFVPEKGRIEISAKSDDGKVLFYVKDNGVGIPKKKIGNMFHKFYQVDTSVTRKHGGSGLGLAICKGYVEGMGGKIWLESEVGKGTTFFFTIPKVN